LVALVDFGADSLIEALARIVMIWPMADSRSSSAVAERRAQQLIAATFCPPAAQGVALRSRYAHGHRVPHLSRPAGGGRRELTNTS
jgi:hypothetical protein